MRHIGAAIFTHVSKARITTDAVTHVKQPREGLICNMSQPINKLSIFFKVQVSKFHWSFSKTITNWPSSLYLLKHLFSTVRKGENPNSQPWFFGRKSNTACFELKQYMGVKKGDTIYTPYIRKYYYTGFFTKNILLDIFSNALVWFTAMNKGPWDYAYLLFVLAECKCFFRSVLHPSSMEFSEAYSCL